MKALGNCYDVFVRRMRLFGYILHLPVGQHPVARDRPMSATRFGPRPLRSVQVLWVYRDFMGQI